MQHFVISFNHRGKQHNAKVHKLSMHPIQFVVYNVHPLIGKLPRRLVFLSNVEKDQLIYQSFDVSQRKIIRSIGEELFRTCHAQKIPVHAKG